MFIKGLLSLFILALCTLSYSPSLSAEEGAKKVHEVISWWEEYGQYWEKAKKKEKEKEEIASVDNK